MLRLFWVAAVVTAFAMAPEKVSAFACGERRRARALGIGATLIPNGSGAPCAPRDFSPLARRPRTCMRRAWYAHNSGCPNNGRRATGCSPTQRCPTGSGRGPPIRSCIRRLGGLAERRRSAPGRNPEPTAATTGRGSRTDWLARALGQAPARVRTSRRAAQRRCFRACGIAPETAARFRRRWLPPPEPASIGSHRRPSRFRPSPWSKPRKRTQRRSPPPPARERVIDALTSPPIRSPERPGPLAYRDQGRSAKSHLRPEGRGPEGW